MVLQVNLNTSADPGGTWLPAGATQITGSSGVVAASAAVATLASAPGRTAYLSGFAVSGLGATGAAEATITITGLLGGTINFGYPAPAGVGVAGPPMAIPFAPALQASGPNVNIVVSVASFGAGNTGASAMATGYLI
jgi:hypothetical protein